MDADDATLETLYAELRRVISARATVEQAKGVLMARHHCDADAAFALLVTESQHRNIKLREIAGAIVAAAAATPLPRPPTRGPG